MSKCRECYSEIGNKVVCPICGTNNNNNNNNRTTSDNKSIAYQIIDNGPKTKSNNQNIDMLEVIEQAKKSVVKIFVEHASGVGMHGTGWCGAKDTIITNAHVISDNEKINSITCEFSKELNLKKNKIPMKAVYVSKLEDIAILKPIEGHLPNEVKVLKIKDEDCRLGEQVFTIGNPLHYEFTYIKGDVANPDYYGKAKKGVYGHLQTTLTLHSGNSGGAVFNNSGEVVGMATYTELSKDLDDVMFRTEEGVIAGTMAKYSEIVGYGFCVKGEAIIAALKNLNK